MEKIKAYALILLRKIKSIILLGLMSYLSAAQADIAVIVNSKNTGVSLSRSGVGDIFLGRINTLPNGSSVKPIDVNKTEEIRTSFYELIAEKNPVEMNIYWSRSNFVGKGTPPMVLQSDEAVVNYVKGNSAAIGYVNATYVKGENGVSIVLLIPKT